MPGQAGCLRSFLAEQITANALPGLDRRVLRSGDGTVQAGDFGVGGRVFERRHRFGGVCCLDGNVSRQSNVRVDERRQERMRALQRTSTAMPSQAVIWRPAATSRETGRYSTEYCWVS